MSLLAQQAASRNYATRPADERYPSLDALITRAAFDKSSSVERTYNLKDLHVTPDGATGEKQTTIILESPKGRAAFTHWSFSQLARTVGAPAGYLRELPPAIASDCLNHGLRESLTGTAANLLLSPDPAGGSLPIVRAATSDSYGRVWDADLYAPIRDQITSRDDRWTLPPTWSGESAGAYRGDRDSFLVLTNGGSIVTDPSAANGDGAMYRGILVRNSEVGSAAVTIESILLRFICGNHMLWGAAVDKQYRRRHVGKNTLRDTIREIGRIAYQWTNQSAERDNAIIRTLIDREVAHTKEGVIDELCAMGASKGQATRAYELCEQKEAVSPRSFWGAAQGLTRLSQDTGYQDDRYAIDKIAAIVMARGARQLVTA